MSEKRLNKITTYLPCGSVHENKQLVVDGELVESFKDKSGKKIKKSLAVYQKAQRSKKADRVLVRKAK